MTNTNALNTTGLKHFQQPGLTVRLSTDDTPPSTVGEISAVLSAESVVQSAGGQALDYVGLDWKVTAALTNRVQPASFTRMVDVLLPDTALTRLALGDYTVESERVSGGEELTAQVQIRGYHFGDPFAGQRWYNAGTTSDVITEEPPVFNPRIDGKILDNRSSKKRDDSEDAYNWVHPEGVLTSGSQGENDQTQSAWDLKEAVLAMCWACNTDETHIANPIRGDLTLLDGAPELEDVRLPLGLYLPEYLDALLQPLGFNWFIDYNTGDVTADPADPYNKNPPEIKIFKVGAGTERELFFQAPEAVLDLALTNTNEYRVSRSIGDSINQVRVIGDYEQAELTMELVKGWPTASDSLSVTDLDKSDSASSYEANPTVHRLWVFNEAGDYNGTRTEITAAPNLSTVFAKWFPHRREMLDPFSYQGGSGKKIRRQIFVEYSTDGGTSWAPVPDEFGQPFVMPDQIGIIFQGDQPPSDLVDAGSNAKIRVTAVIAGDSRLASTADRASHAVNGRVVELQLNMPQKFRKHWVQSTGTWASIFSGGSSGADTVDDSTAIEDFAEEIRDKHEVAEVDCDFSLPGFHLTYEIGDLITKINGREVSLDQASDTAPAPKYVQVVAREFQLNPPRTILTVDRGTRPSRGEA